MKLFKKKLSEQVLIAALEGQKCRVQLFRRIEQGLKQLKSTHFLFTDHKSLVDGFIESVKSLSVKGESCRWILDVDHYQSHTIDAPKVLEEEMREALKWQLKELLERPVDETLVNFYRPSHPDQQNKQIVAIATEKALIESIIKACSDASVQLEAIEIEELCFGQGVLHKLADNQFTGFVGENHAGLVFSFFNGKELCFTRYKKGRYIPRSPSAEEFVLDDEKQAAEENFLLEIQRTLDYVISQIFRRPLDQLLLQFQDDHSQLAETLSSLTDTQVHWVKPLAETSQNCDILPTLVETGCALRTVD